MTKIEALKEISKFCDELLEIKIDYLPQPGDVGKQVVRENIANHILGLLSSVNMLDGNSD